MKLEKIKWRELGRVIVFIDSANIIHSCKTLGWKIGYKALQKYFQQNTNLVDIYFYSATETTNSKQNAFIAMLSRKGFKIRTKKLKYIKQENGTILQKGNIDTELATDIILRKDDYDTAILLSGDSDFQAPIDAVQSFGKKVIVISTRDHISYELIKTADVFLYLDEFKDYWELKVPKITKSACADLG